MHLAVCLVLRCVYATVSSQCIENYLKRSFKVNFRLLVAKKLASKGWVLKISHFQMNNIKIIYIIVVIVIMSEANKLKTVYFRTKRRVQYHAGYHDELAKRYCHFGKV